MRQFSRTSWISHHGSRHAAIAIVCAVAAWSGSAHAQTVPTNPKPTCTVPAATFATWFQSGTPALNGVVKPADSVTFPNTPNCSFYQWSEQMFLWLTSPAPLTYGGGGGRIFDSPVFYDVSPPNASNQRTFIAHTPGFIHPLSVRAAQVGPHGLPVVMTKAGRLLEVERAQPNVVPQIRDDSGKLIQIPHAKLNNGKPTLLDRAGSEVKFTAVPLSKIEPPAPSPTAPRTGLPPTVMLRKFVIDRIPIFVDPANNVIDTEEGQAGGGDVLMSQSSKLIYYVTMANDVFAYFRTSLPTPVPANTQFPTTQAQLTQIVNYASAHGRVLVDADALAIEVKSSWIEASGLANLSSYITMNATIPTYNTSNPNTWTQTAPHTVQLALLGVHVVGSTAGHPEMIWATFEHGGNTPDAGYSYVNTANQTVAVPQTTAGTWLFAANNAPAPFNQAHMTYATPPPCPAGAICAASTFSISPSNTIRWKPWGAASSASPNPLDATAAASNSEIIAINNSVRGQLVGGDVRGNYIMIGSTWTIGGAAPNGSFSQSPSGNEVGTSLLSNSTMETYQQGGSNDTSGSNCFSCHGSNTTSVSHVFNTILPLFK